MTTRINLLPWRDIERADRQKEFLTLLGACALAAALLLAPVYLVIDQFIRIQKDRNKLITDQIVLLDEKIKQIKELRTQREQLLARMQVIQQLQAERTIIVHIYEEVVKMLPGSVYLTELKKTGNTFLIKGVADSNATISKLMRSIEESKWLTQPLLKQINTVQEENNSRSIFEMEMLQKMGGTQKIMKDEF